MPNTPEFTNLAHEALRKAEEARHMAEINALSVSGHEKLCSERYEAINKTLQHIPTIFNDIKDIRVKQAEAFALNKAIALVSAVVGLIYLVMQVTGKI